VGEYRIDPTSMHALAGSIRMRDAKPTGAEVLPSRIVKNNGSGEAIIRFQAVTKSAFTGNGPLNR